MNSRVGRLGGHSHDSRNLTFLFRSREATTHRVYLNEVDTPLRANLYAKPFASHETAVELVLAVEEDVVHPIGLIWDSNSKLRSSASEPASDPRAKRRLAQVVEDELGLEDAAELAGRSVEAILRPMAYQTLECDRRGGLAARERRNQSSSLSTSRRRSGRRIDRMCAPIHGVSLSSACCSSGDLRSATSEESLHPSSVTLTWAFSAAGHEGGALLEPERLLEDKRR